MNNEAVITGTYSDFKIIKTRQVAQVIVEVPIEHAENVVQVFGLPKPNEEQWVAIAHIRTENVTQNSRATKAIQQAGILCKDASFGAWLREKKNLQEIIPSDTITITSALKALLGVASRSEMRSNQAALEVWESIYREYKSDGS